MKCLITSVLVVLLGGPLYAQQLTSTSRLYWNPGPVDAVNGAATSFEVSTDGQPPLDVGPCVQTPASVDPSFQCDAPVPAAALAPGQHTLGLRAKNAQGVSGYTPVPPLAVVGIPSPPTQPGAPAAPQTGPVILDQPPPLQLQVSPNIAVAATSNQGATVTYPAPVPSGGKSPYQVTCTPASGSLFPIAVTTVNCTVVDARSMSAMNSFTVTVTGTAPPGPATGWSVVGNVPVGNTTTRDALVISACEWWITTRKNGVQKTTDCGQTFVGMNNGLGVGQAAADVQWFVVKNGKIFVSALCSTDSPCTAKTGVFVWDPVKAIWNQTGNARPTNGFTTLSTGELMATVFSMAGNWEVYQSKDDGATWTDLSGAIFHGVGGQLFCDATDVCWLSTEASGVWMSGPGMFGPKDWAQVCGCSGGTGFAQYKTDVLYFMQAQIRRFDPTT